MPPSQLAPEKQDDALTCYAPMMKKEDGAIDWSRELATCEPDYYGHEQALFLDLMEHGLVFRTDGDDLNINRTFLLWEEEDISKLG